MKKAECFYIVSYLYINGNHNGMKNPYWFLPRSVRKILIRLQYLLSSFRRLCEAIRPTVAFLRGKERSCGRKLCIAVAGPPEIQSLFSTMAFSDPPDCLNKGRIWIWNAASAIKQTEPSCSLAILQSWPIFERWMRLSGTFRIPPWIELVLDITPEGINKKRNRFNDLARTIRNNQLSFVSKKSDKDFRDFYYGMYKPYIQSRHGRSAVIIPFNRMKEQMIDGELIIILMGNNPIAGCLLKKNNGQVVLSKLGVLNGDFNYVKSGCISAMVYFVVHYLQNKGHKTMHMGFSRPFLSDGPLHFKKLFGARIPGMPQHKTREMLFMKPMTRDQAMHDFLVANSFVCYSGAEKLQVAVFSESHVSGLQVSYADFRSAVSGIPAEK